VIASVLTARGLEEYDGRVMPTSPDHTTPDAPPTYNSIAVTPVPGHDGVYATPAALAAVEEMGGFDRLVIRLFLSWAALRPTSRTTHRSDDGQREHVLAYRHGLDGGEPGIVVSLTAEAGDAPRCAAMPTPASSGPLLPTITWGEAAAADVLVDVDFVGKWLGFSHALAVHAGVWRAVVVQHDHACAPRTPEDQRRLIGLLNAVPRGHYPSHFTATASDGSTPVRLVAEVDRWGDVVIKLAEDAANLADEERQP
jgi:hypothetical protein